MTLELLHLEYLEQHPQGLRYTAFCDVYRKWLAKSAATMRHVHKAGEKCFVDFSGKLPSYVDPATGDLVDVELFVAVLGASNFTFAVATATQTVKDFILAHVAAFESFGGAPEVVVSDQLKSAVSKSCRYEPGIQETYAQFARHYGTAILPARPYKPREKAKVEVAVQIAQRWILARLRRETFFSLSALNARIAELCAQLNDRPMKKLGGVSRRSLFDRLDRPALRRLPASAFEFGEWKQVRIGLDYHVQIHRHWYSVPAALIHERVWAWTTARTVEVFHRGQRVACHVRNDVAFQHSTTPEHMPESHRRHAAGAEAVLAWAATVGPMTESMVRRLIESNPVREQGWRSARGLQRTGEKYEAQRTELACAHALRFGARSYKPIANILALGRESLPLPDEDVSETRSIAHENVRGADYYH